MDSLVSTQWLEQQIGSGDLAVIDASLHLPASGRDAREEFKAAHIPGARFFDLAGLIDTSSDVPSALPTPEQLAGRLAELGVAADDRIVLYDDSALRSAARGWYLFVAHGLGRVAILDGGFSKWRAESRPVESGFALVEPAEAMKLPAPSRLRMKADIVANIESAEEQVVDARAADRFESDGIDPVHGVAGGHIPGARNLPFGKLFAEDGTYRSPQDIRAAFEDAGIDLQRPVVTSCGSGVTASPLLFALDRIGKSDWALYDGSWSDWGGDPSTPKESGPAKELTR